MKLRRFLHLEGRRPEHADAGAAASGDGLVVEAAHPDAAFACVSCGDPLPDAETACARCAAFPPSNGNGRHADRFRLVAGHGSLPVGGEVAERTPEAEVAATVPAWRGEALPPDVAAEVRQKFGIPDQAPQQQQREDVLAWAQRQLEQERTRNLLWWIGAIFFGRRILANLIGGILAAIVLATFLLWRACAG